MQQKAQQLANANGDLANIIDEKKSKASHYKDLETRKQAEINILSRNIREGEESVTKTCDVLFDFEKGEKVYTWNKEVVGRIKMIAADYALDIEFPDENVAIK